MDLVEMGWGDVDWIGLAQDRDRLSLEPIIFFVYLNLWCLQSVACMRSRRDPDKYISA
jgi:hypothetical protein